MHSANEDMTRWTHVDATRPQKITRRLLSRLGRWWTHYQAIGHEPRVPDHGGFLLAMGPHGSYMDALVFLLGQSRTRLRFMGKREIFSVPLLGRFMRWGGVFPVDRSGGKGAHALAVAEAVVNSGDGVALFPEGKFYLDREGLGEARSGVARLALITGAPVIVAAAYGAKRPSAYGRPPWSRRQVVVAWGEPMQRPKEGDPSRERIEAVRDEIWLKMHQLYEQARAH